MRGKGELGGGEDFRGQGEKKKEEILSFTLNHQPEGGVQ